MNFYAIHSTGADRLKRNPFPGLVPATFRFSQARLRQVIMRINLIIAVMIAGLLQVHANTYGQKITLTAKNASFKDVIGQVMTQSGYGFLYTEAMLQNAKPVNVDLKNASIEETLQQIFAGQPLEYSIDEKTVVMKRKEPSILDKIKAALNIPITVSGRVTDSLGTPLIGASISVTNSNKSIITDDKGEFSLTAQVGDQIIITYIGYKPYDFFVKENQPFMTIALHSTTAKLNEVVVNTGYQTISEEKVVGSYGKLDSAAYARRAGTGIIDRLDGTVPGVLFDYKTNSNTLDRIKIRGLSSLGGVGSINTDLLTPLIILDNFPYSGDLNSINQNDVESITVLKDAAAASIWGARAGNGVIVITTKKGKYNQPLQISMTSNVTIQEKPNLYYYPQMTSSDYINVEEYLFGNGFYDANLSDPTYPQISPVVAILAQRRAGLISAADSAQQLSALRGLDVRKDLNKYVYRPAIAQEHHLEFTGGNSIINYELSGGYNKSAPDIQNSKSDDQYTLNSNISIRPVKNLEIQTGINYSQSTKRSVDFSLPTPFYQYSLLANANGGALAIPYQYNQGYIDTAGAGKLLDWNYRPLDEIRDADNVSTNKSIILNFNASYRLFDWLSASLKYQYTDQESAIRNFYSLQTYYTRNLINTFTNLSQTDPSTIYPVPLGGILDLFNQP